jgi:membrane protease YdiL (CAAX protease family)
MSTSTSLHRDNAQTALLGVVLIGIPLLNAHVLQPWVTRSADGPRTPWWIANGILLLAHALVFVYFVLGPRQSAEAKLVAPSPTQLRVLLAIVATGALVFAARQFGLYHATWSSKLAPRGGVERGAYLVYGVVIGGLQEPLWRSAAYWQLRQRFGLSSAAAIGVTAVSFGYFHGGLSNLGQVAFITAAAVGLSHLYLRTRSIWSPVIVHVAFNVFTASFA